MNLLLNRLLNGTAGSFPATVFIGLYSATPSDTGGGTEVTSGNIGGYARQPVVTTTVGWTTSTVGSSANVATINYGTASSGTGVTITQYGVFDALTVGNLLAWADLTTQQNVGNQNPYSFAIGALVIAGI